MPCTLNASYKSIPSSSDENHPTEPIEGAKQTKKSLLIMDNDDTRVGSLLTKLHRLKT